VETGIIPGPGGPEVVSYVVRGDQAIVEGDMVFPLDYLDEYVNGPMPASASRWEFSRWPDGHIPIVIDSDVPNKDRLYAAVAEYSIKTDILFYPADTDPSDGDYDEDYVRFVRSDIAGDCRSHVGRLGTGEQNVWISDDCSTGNLIHELGHTVGLYHEHTRRDRDDYVAIIWENIEDDKESNFQKYTHGYDLGPYDYGSIMHYGDWAFRDDDDGDGDFVDPGEFFDGVSILQLFDFDNEIGQRDELSAGDIAGIATLYSKALCPDETPERPELNLVSAGKWSLTIELDAQHEGCRPAIDYWQLLDPHTTGDWDELPARITINGLFPDRWYCYTAVTYRGGPFSAETYSKCFKTKQNTLSVGGYKIKM
jgi:hypothetical protein